MELAPGTQALFVPSDPPRDGVLALWGHGGGDTPIDLVLPREQAFRRTQVDASVLPVADAVRVLLAAGEHASATITAWAEVVAAGLSLVARGRVEPDGASWRAGPLEVDDALRLTELAEALPPEALALPLSGLKRVRLHSPESLVRALWDAIADLLAEDTAVRLVLRVDLAEERFAGVLAVRSAADSGLVLDVAEFGDAPEVVRSLFGEHVQVRLALALRRGAEVWPPLARVAGGVVELTDDEVAELLRGGSSRLGAAGIEVLWPKDLFEGLPRVRASVRVPSESPPQLTLTRLLDFRWQVSVGEEELTDAEVTALAEAKRPLVRLRGRWVRADSLLLAKLRARRSPVTEAAALAAALTGELEVDGEREEFMTPSVITGLLARLRYTPDEVVVPPEGLHATLRPYQLSGLAWLSKMAALGVGGCLADDMGLGKTIQLIALHLHRRAWREGPTLVLCPASLLGNWEREFARFAPSVPVRRFHGGRRSLDGLAEDEVVLATYGVLLRDRETLETVEWGLIAADEAQQVKNAASKTARELRKLYGVARIALTGTPMENRLTELWSILNWTTPGLLGSPEEFRRRFARPIERHADEAATDRLAAVVRPFLLRRKKTDPDIAPELPAKTETDRFVPLTREQVTLYEAVVRENLAAIRGTEGIQRKAQVLKLLTELKQICNHPAQYLKEPGPLDGRSGKLAAFEELLEVMLDAGESVLVFSQYVGMCRLLETWLAERGLPAQLLSGSVPLGERDRMVQRFQAGESPVFLLSLKAGGVGLNLTRATQVIHYDRWWNPAVEDQATDRAYRIGQDRPVQVHRLITEGTVEERIGTLLTRKRTLANTIIGTGEHWLTNLTDEDLTTLITLNL
ncbi:DEAD/DEAH box helicase [Amycolatopsis magusensis]|uniref:SNF2 family DNA or RNA helicase n=1 Tax=Amycolatopsis magusensis TaxID=882444 RepID=A0ABS4Q2P4_9PSEU|nr:DEAD/DEAH box helicase [Amycolatopsis magusensis]MBP2185950.1 SNF2 family DNA or RNA helicase [Amycolatopsis magusensis]